MALETSKERAMYYGSWFVEDDERWIVATYRNSRHGWYVWTARHGEESYGEDWYPRRSDIEAFFPIFKKATLTDSERERKENSKKYRKPADRGRKATYESEFSLRKKSRRFSDKSAVENFVYSVYSQLRRDRPTIAWDQNKTGRVALQTTIPDIVFDGGVRRSATSWGGKIKLPNVTACWAWTPEVLLHEIAHEMLCRLPVQAHGEEFRSVYLWLLSRFDLEVGHGRAGELADEYTKRGLSFDPDLVQLRGAAVEEPEEMSRAATKPSASPREVLSATQIRLELAKLRSEVHELYQEEERPHGRISECAQRIYELVSMQIEQDKKKPR